MDLEATGSPTSSTPGSAPADPYEAFKSTKKPEDLHAVVNMLAPTIEKAVNYYAGPDATPIVHGRARILAAEAVRSYDPAKGASLETHVTRQLQALQRLHTRLTSPFSPNEQVRRERAAVFEAGRRLKDELGRDPTDEEIVEATGMTKKRFNKLRGLLNSQVPLGVAESAVDDDDRDPEIATQQRTPYDDWLDAVYHSLAPRDRLILQYRSGYGGSEVLPAAEIAKRIGLPVSTVNARIAALQKQINRFTG